jgi:hypothetical protein
LDAFEDAAADVFIRAFRSRGTYVAQRDSALPWLLGIANHVIGDPQPETVRLKGAPGRCAAPCCARSAGVISAVSW